MNEKIKLGSYIDRYSVLEWKLKSNVEFTINKTSSFQLGVEGLALSRLKSLLSRDKRVIAVCDFSEPFTDEDYLDNFFSSVFGFAIARLASEILFDKGHLPASNEFKRRLGELYKNKKGKFGSDKVQTLICVDPIFKYPPIFGETKLDVEQFPMPSAFKTVLTKIQGDMKIKNFFNSWMIKDAVHFIYEIFRNTWEHGISEGSPNKRQGTRAIIFEKIIVTSLDMENQKKIPSEFVEYVRNALLYSDYENKLTIVCITISDQGEGIQNTLPAKLEETPKARLGRAFVKGESRKIQGAIKRGHGLDNMVMAAHNLGARLEVISNGISLIQDFSLSKDDKYPVINFEEKAVEVANLNMGTCISICLPQHSNPDQHLLKL